MEQFKVWNIYLTALRKDTTIFLSEIEWSFTLNQILLILDNVFYSGIAIFLFIDVASIWYLI